MERLHYSLSRWRVLLLAKLGVLLLLTAVFAAPILGQYPTGNVVVTFEGEFDDFTTHIAIDHVGAGLTMEANWPWQIVFDAGDGVSHTRVFEVDQEIILAWSGDRGPHIRSDGESRSVLRSTETGAVFLWEPHFRGSVTCVHDVDSRNPIDGCDVFEVKQEFVGYFSGPNGRGTCGSLNQVYEFIVHELEKRGEASAVIAPGTVVRGFGELKVNNQHCARAIYGVMPGDNVTIDLSNQSASISAFFDEADALFGSRSQVRDSHDRYANAEFAFTGMLRDGTRFTGAAQGEFTVREDSARGEVMGEVRVSGVTDPIPFRGHLRLENIILNREGGLSAQGTLRFFPSQTEGENDS